MSDTAYDLAKTLHATDVAAWTSLIANAISAEREACAKICDDYSARAWAAQYPSQEAAVAASNLAKAIRSKD